MRITDTDRETIRKTGVNKLIELCELESVKLTQSLKVATDMNAIRHIQGELNILDKIVSL